MAAAKWTVPALRNLEEIEAYIKADDPEAAANVAQAVWDATMLLEEYPKAGRPGRLHGTREMVVTGTPYLVAYRVKAGILEVLRVIHEARKRPKRL